MSEQLDDLPYPVIEDPKIEVHSFHSLGREVKHNPYTLSLWLRKGKFKVVAFNHQKNRNVFAITRKEVERVVALLGSRKAEMEARKIKLKVKKQKAALRRTQRKLARKYK